MKVFIFDEVTGEFLTEYVAHKNPVAGGFILPKSCTKIAPPSLKEGEKAIFKNGAWSVEKPVIEPLPVKTEAEIEAEKVAIAKAELLEIDLSSVRAMREYIASKDDAPQFLKNKEKAAIEKRMALKNG